VECEVGMFRYQWIIETLEIISESSGACFRFFTTTELTFHSLGAVLDLRIPDTPSCPKKLNKSAYHWWFESIEVHLNRLLTLRRLDSRLVFHCQLKGCCGNPTSAMWIVMLSLVHMIRCAKSRGYSFSTHIPTASTPIPTAFHLHTKRNHWTIPNSVDVNSSVQVIKTRQQRSEKKSLDKSQNLFVHIMQWISIASNFQFDRNNGAWFASCLGIIYYWK
jgi:hypothetical protein